MTTAQINSIISEFGYSLDEWYDFAKFPIIFLDQDAKIFTDYKRKRIRFNSVTNSVEIAIGDTIKNVFTSNYGETKNFTPKYNIDMKIVCGFCRTAKILSNGQIMGII